MTSADDARPAPPNVPAPFVQAMRTVNIAALAALIVLGLAWELVIAPTGSGTLAIKVLPLVLALAGLWRHRLYTYRWLSMLVWLYFAEGVVRATTERGASQVMAVLEILLCLVLFGASVLYIRHRLGVAKPA